MFQILFDFNSKIENIYVNIYSVVLGNYNFNVFCFSGCSCEFVEGALYNALKSNNTLVKLYEDNARSLGIPFDYTGGKQGGSTDMGNVSTIKPSIHPKFQIDSSSGPHTKGFCDAAILTKNQKPTILCAKSLAMTAIDVILNPALLDDIRKDFSQ